MYLESKGIVLGSIKYSETSIICKIYTAKFGLQSYIINGVRKKKGGSAYYQPLNILDLTVYHKNKSQLQRIKEVKNPLAYQSIPFHVYKSSIALFIAEVLGKCLKEEEENLGLFNFIESSLLEFDKADFDSQFHLRFMLALSGFLGFYPNLENHHLPYFNLMDGCFCETDRGEKHIIKNSTDFVSALKLEKTRNKNKILEQVLSYYELHVDGFGKIKSKSVLESVLKVW